MSTGFSRVQWIAIATTVFLIGAVVLAGVISGQSNVIKNVFGKWIGQTNNTANEKLIKMKCRQKCQQNCREGFVGKTTIIHNGERITCSTRRAMGVNWSCIC